MLPVPLPSMNLNKRRLAALAAGAALAVAGCTSVAPLANTAIKLGLVKLAFSCLPEGAEIDTPSGPRAVESIRPGEWVVGYRGAPVRVLQVHSYAENPDHERFHRIEFSNGARIDLCDMHRVGGVRARSLAQGETVAGLTVERLSTYGGVRRSYDLLTEDEGYRIDGVPVNSMIAEMAEALRDGAVPLAD